MACGDSYNRTITVTGKLPDKDWGAQFRRTLPPLLGPGAIMGADWGRNTANEAEIIQDGHAILRDLRREVLDDESIRGADRQGLLELLNAGDIQLEAVPAVYQPWREFLCIRGMPEAGVCPWPLEWGDDIEQWFFRCDKPYPGQTFVGADGKARTCPPPSLAIDRVRARDEIRDLIIGAYRFARCAEYWLTKWRLWLQALETYEPQLDPFTAFGTPTEPGPSPTPAPGAGIGELGVQFDPVEPPPPPTGPGPFEMFPAAVDPDALPPLPLPEPDAEAPPQPGDEPPPEADEGVAEGEGVPEPPRPAGANTGTLLALGAAGLVLLALARR